MWNIVVVTLPNMTSELAITTASVIDSIPELRRAQLRSSTAVRETICHTISYLAASTSVSSCRILVIRVRSSEVTASARLFSSA